MQQSLHTPSRCPGCQANAWRYLTRKNAYAVFRCRTCSTLSVGSSQGIPAAIYNKEYFSGATHGHGYVDYDADKAAMRDVFLSYFALFKRYGINKGKLLDIGAATGYFVQLALEQGFRASGIEISDYAAELGRQKGLDVATGTLRSVELPSSSFDVITLFDVIEHVEDPEADMQRVASLLVPNGFAIINTPDASSTYARLLGSKWHLIVPPEHLYCFSRRGFTQLLERVGLKVVLMTTIGKRFTVEYILQTLGRWLRMPFLIRFAGWLGRYAIGRIGLPINLRDNMFVIAQKR